MNNKANNIFGTREVQNDGWSIGIFYLGNLEGFAKRIYVKNEHQTDEKAIT